MSSFTIGKKLFLGVGTLVVFTFALGITGVLSLSSVNIRLQTIVGPTMHKSMLVTRMALDAAQILSFERGVILRGYMKDLPEIEKSHQQLTAIANDMQAAIDEITPMLVTPGGKQAVQEIEDGLVSEKDASEKIFHAAMEGDMTLALIPYTDVVMPQQRIQSEASQRLATIQQGLATGEAESAEASIVSNRWVAGLLLALACCVAAVVMIVIRQITLVLRNSVGELAQAAAQIASAAGQVSASSQSLAQGASEQTATIEETSSASVEVNSMSSGKLSVPAQALNTVEAYFSSEIST